ncbi:hypothetical protein [Nocardia sp. NPDC024068]|uniref:hypothetical protein n=1 Tax=Nocardia sp. NPDC024068 TaxID=3157197 RepID=UPI0033CA709E
MAQSLRIDLERLRTLSPELAQIAAAAQRELAALEIGLAEEGRFWGEDEPGRLFGEAYAPELDNGLSAFRTVIDNLGRVGTAVGDAGDTFERQDQEGNRWIQDPSSPGTPLPDAPGTSPGEQFPGDIPPGSGPARYPGPATTGTEPAGAPVAPLGETGGSSTHTFPYSTTTAGPDNTATTGPGSAGTDAGFPGDISSGTEYPAARSDPSALGGQPAPASATRATPGPPGERPGAVRPTAAPGTPAARAAPGSPWSQPKSATGAASSTAPWKRSDAAAGPGRNQISAPNSAGPPPGNHPAQPPRGGKKQQKKTEPIPGRPSDDAVHTDPAALEAARALADRHGLRLTGFETSGIGAGSVGEIAAALDDILGKYPFLALGGIDITDLPADAVYRVRWDRLADEPAAARILLRRSAFATPEGAAATTTAATAAGLIAPRSGDRPVYATIVHALGRVVADTAGPAALRSAEQVLITEYHRISGPWNRGDTLAAVVRGYREWRGSASDACFTHGRLDPLAASVDSFAEVELRAGSACGPAKALHRVAVERARGRSVP